MKVEKWGFPDELLYDRHHQWVRLADGFGTVGLTDFGQESRGDVLYVQLPLPGCEVDAGQPVATIETGKWVGRIYAPLPGVIDAVNTGLETDPGLINRSPYEDGWILRLRCGPGGGGPGLMCGEAFGEWVGVEVDRYRLDGTGAGG